MEIRKATAEDFDIVFDFIEKLWTYNTYDREEIRKVYMDVINDECSFAFLLWDEGICRGMCHGDYFNTFWMSGLTCYVSSLITREEDRGKGYGVALLDHAKELAKQRGDARPSPLIPDFRGQGHMASMNTMDLKRAVMASR